MVWINTYRTAGAGTVRGVKESGFGRERDEEGLGEFLRTKNVIVAFSDESRDPFAIRV
jgi:aldehyde dehydrogenase (NAD+)